MIIADKFADSSVGDYNPHHEAKKRLSPTTRRGCAYFFSSKRRNTTVPIIYIWIIWLRTAVIFADKTVGDYVGDYPDKRTHGRIPKC